MKTTYCTNGVQTTQSLTEWYFGKAFVKKMTASALQMNAKTGKTSLKFWQDGTGYLTVKFN